jgi:hypothetical protein
MATDGGRGPGKLAGDSQPNIKCLAGLRLEVMPEVAAEIPRCPVGSPTGLAGYAEVTSAA